MRALSMQQKLKINFADFWSGDFDPNNNDFINLLRQKYEVELSDEPDYLFYSVFGNDHLNYDCIRIFYTGECVTPNFNECDYAIGFDRFSFADRYLRVPLYRLFQYKTEYETLFDRKPFTAQELAQKENFCAFVVSNDLASSPRSFFFDLMSTYKTVSSGGRYRNNIPGGGPAKDKKAFQQKCKFAIAFENTAYPGYATEKIMEAFAARTIPIYYGDPEIELDFNPAAFINCHRYQTFEQVLERVKELDHDDAQALQMLNQPPVLCKTDDGLAEFLYHIVEQPLAEAARRPHSTRAHLPEELVLRHAWYEKHVYPPIAKIKAGFRRLKNRAV